MDTVGSATSRTVDPAIFERLQANIDSDGRVREELRNILQRRDRQGRMTQSLLSRAHSVPEAELEEALKPAWSSIMEQVNIIKEIETVASKHPYYKYNQLWTRDVQETVRLHKRTLRNTLRCPDLGCGFSRLAVNSVTLGDYQRPLQISQFVKDVHAGFQILNLKNDVLRKRSDSIKYNVKKIEDVVYDLSLRNLIPRKSL
ncbi:MAG: hypothetical protein Q9182_004006 [Xanthomendoza sp. 2 TL-2023]